MAYARSSGISRGIQHVKAILEPQTSQLTRSHEIRHEACQNPSHIVAESHLNWGFCKIFWCQWICLFWWKIVLSGSSQLALVCGSLRQIKNQWSCYGNVQSSCTELFREFWLTCGEKRNQTSVEIFRRHNCPVNEVLDWTCISLSFHGHLCVLPAAPLHSNVFFLFVLTTSSLRHGPFITLFLTSSLCNHVSNKFISLATLAFSVWEEWPQQ